MEFNGTFTLEDASVEEVWLALSDPVMIERALPGCQFLAEVGQGDVDFDELEASAGDDDPPTLPEADVETVAERAFAEGGQYAALMEVGVGSVKPRFETLVSIDRREFPDMDAVGEGNATNSSFEMRSGMRLSETDDGVDVEWWTEADVFGRVAQMGQRVINPVANRVVNRFFKQIQSQLTEVGTESSPGIRDKVRNLL
jgi:hypothetical protein